MEQLLKILTTRRQLITYCLIGATTTVLDFCTYTMLINLLGHGHYQIANVAGYGVGTVASFAINAWFNFCVRDRIGARFVAFCGVAVLGWAVSASLLHLFIGRLGWNVYVSKLISLFGVLLVQYNLNRRLAFRKIN